MGINTISPDFKGQEFHLGIDVHSRNWKVTIISNDMVLKTFSMDSRPEELHKYMNRHYPNGTYKSVYEAGFCGYWIHRKLESLNFENIIVNPADVPSTNKERDQKSDPIDSKKLARELRNKSLRGIFVPNEHQEALRMVHRVYRQRSGRVTQTKNRIKGYLHFIGIAIPQEYSGRRCWSRSFIDFLRNIQCSDSLHKIALDNLILDLTCARERKLESIRQIHKISKELPIVQQLRTIPGIGKITSFALYAEIVDINRFRNLDHLSSYVGLVPSIQSSDQTVKVGGIVYRHCKYLRPALIESAWVSLRNDPALLSAYNELTRRMPGQDAIIRIAKKLLNRVRYVWKNQQSYSKGVVQVL